MTARVFSTESHHPTSFILRFESFVGTGTAVISLVGSLLTTHCQEGPHEPSLLDPLPSNDSQPIHDHPQVLHGFHCYEGMHQATGKDS